MPATLRLLATERFEPKWRRLARHPLLAGYPLRLLRRVASAADEVVVFPGAVLAKQGRPAEWFFLIHSGEAEVARGADHLGVLGPGAYFGEVALLGRGPQPVTVRAVTTMTVSVIGAQRFVPLVDDIHRLRLDMEASLVRQAELVELTRVEHLRRLRPRSPGSGRPGPAGTAPTGAAPSSSPPVVAPVLRAVAIPPKVMPVAARLSARWRVALVGAALTMTVTIGATSTLYHPPVAVIAPGPAIDVSRDVGISGMPVHQPRGRYLMVTTRSQRPNLLGLGLALLHRDEEILPVHQMPRPPSRPTPRQGDSRAEFAQSRLAAATAAARAAGLPVPPSGQPPFTVHFRNRDIVGPSAGLIYALAIEDMLTAGDRRHGRVIAATGQIGPTGAVTGVGYVTEKAEAARRAGVQLLLVPESDIDSASASGVPVEGVDSLEQALTDLAAGSPA